MLTFNTTIPLSLYIHIPWCVRKCPYCDFNSHAAGTSLPEKAYVQALLDDLDEQLPHIWGRRLISIFFGGGTPSLFSSAAIADILAGVHRRLNFGPDIEITLEANPGTVDEKRFLGFREAGVNRLSIGVQSLQNEKLFALGRIHNRDYALRAIESASQAGFKNFNIDLMHGLPNQSLTDATADLLDAIAFQPPHLSWYQLTIEPNTFFHYQPPVLPKEETLWDIQDSGHAALCNAGFLQYEVSAYSQLEHQCVHNLNYWEFGDYLGIGAGAHSKITNIAEGKIFRHWQIKNPRDYLNSDKAFTARKTELLEKDIFFEFMLNALRLTQGVEKKLFMERTGLAIDVIKNQLEIAKTKKFLVDDEALLCVTPFGLRFLNDVIEIFLNY